MLALCPHGEIPCRRQIAQHRPPTLIGQDEQKINDNDRIFQHFCATVISYCPSFRARLAHAAVQKSSTFARKIDVQSLRAKITTSAREISNNRIHSCTLGAKTAAQIVPFRLQTGCPVCLRRSPLAPHSAIRTLGVVKWKIRYQ
jgi:hypothetical protein